MRLPKVVAGLTFLLFLSAVVTCTAAAQSSSSSRHGEKPLPDADRPLPAGSVSNGAYRNPDLGFSCKIPAGWVLRTADMNARDAEQSDVKVNKDAPSGSGQVLLAAFSRPPQARAEDVNSSILIAAEGAASYPGLKDAAQYFGPLSEVTKAQGFTEDEDPYEIAIGTKNLARGDFHKDVSTRVMHQSTLAMLSHGYAISITIIAGTEDDVEELIDGLTFTGGTK